jgi:phytoene dehydrogenase-like protein
MPRETYDAVVVGAGPNGFAAAITLATAGRSVLIIEAKETVGGGSRSAELTLPGFVNDVCSAIHPLGVGSPFFQGVPLEEHGLEWIHPRVPLAHPLDDGTAVLLDRSVERTAEGLGSDSGAYRRIMRPLVAGWDKLAAQVLGPVLRPPRHPFFMAGFGLRAVRSARSLATRAFKGERARAVFAGCAAHSILPLERPLTASVGFLLAVSAHAVGWPFPQGGSQKIVDALASYLSKLGGEIVTGWEVGSIDELPRARSYLFDVTPRQLVQIAGKRLPDGYRRRLARFRHGPGVFKIDHALDGPIPWKAEECLQAGTVHLGGTLAEIAESEREVAEGKPPERPFVLIGQQSVFDPSRAPEGKHTVWSYCHVPNSSTFDMTDRIEDQIERFAPGFRDLVLKRSVMTPANFEVYNPNYIGGDISGGSHDGLQLFARPTLSLAPYATPADGIFLCSSSTPPGGGVHGMCGYFAAKAVLRRTR